MLEHHVPALLQRARALLRLPGGPEDRLGRGELAPAAAAVRALHEGLVGDRSLAGSATYDSRTHLGAYLLWWWPQTYAKVRAVVPLLPPARLGRVLDVGAGPGPAAIALLDAGASSAVAFDASAGALGEARALGGAHLETHEGELVRSPPAHGAFDTICAANVLSELRLDAAARAALVARLAAERLAPGGTLLLLEPALRETGRALLEVRDALLSAHGLHAVAPCFTQRACPALENPRDWCTTDRRWSPPRHVVQLADALGLRSDELLSFAWVAFRREPLLRDADLWRVVGEAPPEKGKKRLWICSDAGRVPLVRLDRDAGERNAAFDALHRGDAVRLGGLTQKGDGLRVTPDSTVEPA